LSTCRGKSSDAVARDARHGKTRTLCDEISKGDFVPQKVRELVAELERAGFINRGGKGSHRNFVHPKVSKPITISGALGDDAKHYQVRAVKRAVEESKS
jgi:predicted RNA binding protein YcfA (HicA-like mRNA interferase family)